MFGISTAVLGTTWGRWAPDMAHIEAGIEGGARALVTSHHTQTTLTWKALSLHSLYLALKINTLFFFF